MGVSVKGTEITMTRGDTLRVQVAIQQNGDTYTPGPSDTVRFAAKRAVLNATKTAYEDDQPKIVKTIPPSTLLLELEPSDTKNLAFGVYDYDIQLTKEDGTVDTFITGKLMLKPEVD